MAGFTSWIRSLADGFKRLGQWAKPGIWNDILAELSKDAEPEAIMIDASYSKLHQHGTGAKGGTSPGKPDGARADWPSKFMQLLMHWATLPESVWLLETFMTWFQLVHWFQVWRLDMFLPTEHMTQIHLLSWSRPLAPELLYLQNQTGLIKGTTIGTFIKNAIWLNASLPKSNLFVVLPLDTTNWLRFFWLSLTSRHAWFGCNESFWKQLLYGITLQIFICLITGAITNFMDKWKFSILQWAVYSNIILIFRGSHKS